MTTIVRNGMNRATRQPARPLTEGLSIGTLVTHGNLAMLPLLGPDRPGPDYILLSDALKQGLATVTEVSESGQVPNLAVRNDCDRPLLALDGEELRGAKQNRILNLSLLVPARSTTVVPVSCVEQGRWDYRTREFGSSGEMLFAKAKVSKMMNVSASMRQHGTHHSDQREVWDHVERKLRSLGAASSTSAMDEAYTSRRKSLGDHVRALKPVAGQRGAAFFIGRKLSGIETLDRASSWVALAGTISRSYALDAIEAEHRETPPPREADATALLEALAGAEADVYRAVGLGEDWRVDSERVVAAGLVVDGIPLHVEAFRRVKRDKQRFTDPEFYFTGHGTY
jgi:hypothetical protein